MNLFTVIGNLIKAVRYYIGRLEVRAVTTLLGRYNSGDISNNVVFKCPGNVYLGNNIKIGPGCVFGSSGKITIGQNSRLSEGVIIETSCLQINKINYGVHQVEDVVIGDNVWIAMHSIVLPGVRIGDDSFIAAGSIVDRDVPTRSVFIRGEIKARIID